VGLRKPLKFVLAGKDYLLEVEESTASDYMLKPGELIVWTKKTLAKELVEEKVIELKLEKWEEKQGK